MTRPLLVWLAWASLATAGAHGAGPAPTITASTADVLAAESLLHCAVDMTVMTDQVGQAGRLRALIAMAQKLHPDDPETNRLQSDIYEVQQLADLAAKSLEVYLKAYPEDYEQSLRWLRLNLQLLPTAGDRSDWLESVHSDLPAPLESQAVAMMGRLLRREGRTAEARDALERAMQLDAANVTAARELLMMKDSPAPHERVEVLLTALKASAGDAEAASELAGVLALLGLHEEALIFFEHLWSLENRSEELPPNYETAVAVCNAMLDGGRYRQAVERLQPLVKQFDKSVDLKSLLIEAWLKLDDREKAEEQADAIAAIYRPAEITFSVTPDDARELAMFYLLTRPNPNKALRYARRVIRAAPGDVVARRILGAAEAASGDVTLVKIGRKRLEKLVERDIYAAVFLAQHCFAEGDETAGRGSVLAGMKMAPSGPAWRRLMELAEVHGVQPPADTATDGEIAKLISAFDRRYLTMAAAPEKFVEVKIQAVASTVAPGEAVEVELILRNISDMPVPLGRCGILKAAVGLTVMIDGSDDLRFEDLPLVLWPAPRYLKVGQTLRSKVRLDVGRLERFLAARPLEEIALIVRANVDPYRYDEKVVSAAPSIKIADLRIVRSDLMGEFDRRDASLWPARYQRALGLIVRDMKQGRLAQRMRAARQVGALISLARGIELGEASPPPELKGEVTKPVLLTMLREVLKDPSDAVRAEMIASLLNVPLDERIQLLLGPSIQDPSPLVRLRAVELFGAGEPAGGRKVVDLLSQDADPMVQLMGRAFPKP